jgi:hypothetical protein
VGGSPVNFATGIAISQNAISRRDKRVVWDHKSQQGGQVAPIDTEVNSVDHFGVSGSEVLKSLHQDSRYREIRSPDGVKGH